jgi:hypothetical protein
VVVLVGFNYRCSGAKLKNWKYKIENTPATATLALLVIVLLITGNGSGLPANINAKNKIGFPLEGFICKYAKLRY